MSTQEWEDDTWSEKLIITKKRQRLEDALRDPRIDVPDPGPTSQSIVQFSPTHPITLLRDQTIVALRAYAHVIHNRGPPDTRFGSTWTEFYAGMETVKYLSDTWKELHPLFASGSRAGTMVGINPYTTPGELMHQLYFGEPPETVPIRAYFKCRGLKLESFINKLYTIVCGECILIKDLPTCVSKKTPYMSATPDGGITVFVSKNAALAAKSATQCFSVDRIVEWKAPNTSAYLEIPPHYMAQIQHTLYCTGHSVCDFGSLYINDKTFVSEFIVIRVWASETYIENFLLPGIRRFCYCYYAGIDPPPRGYYTVPHVRTEMVFRRQNVIDLVPDGHNIITKAKSAAWAEAYQNVKH